MPADSPMTEAHKQALLAAFYLSKFDRKGVRALGYETFNEAFDKIGELLNVLPSTVKHMRDSFDPYCSHVRVGWYQRTILPSRANVLEAYNDISQEAMTEVVRELLKGNAQAALLYTAPITKDADASPLLAENTPFAQRIQTGEQAEAFFMVQFPTLPEFTGSALEDTRKLGTGFDFRTLFPQKGYYAVEVKGLRAPHGAVTFTDKEWSVAHLLGDAYFLALVRALDTAPLLQLFRNPAECVPVKMKSIESVSICWNANL